jgi:hypothetical protein
LPYATFVNIGAVFGWLAVAIHLWRKPLAAEGKERLAFLLLSGAVLAHFVEVTAYWGGNPIGPISARYFLPECAFASYLLFRALMLLPVQAKRLSLFALLAGFGAFVFYTPVTFRAALANDQDAILKLNYALSVLEHEDRDRMLVIADFPGRYATRNYGVVSYEYFNRRQDELLARLAREEVRDIIAVQQLDPRTKEARKLDAFERPPKMETIDERLVLPNMLVRISRVTP